MSGNPKYLDLAKRWIIFAASALMLGGCAPAPAKKAIKDPFFDKWRSMAKESRGYSPVAKQYEVDLPDEKTQTVPEQKTEPIAEKSLPTETVTLKMHNVEVGTLLRALARSAEQNIVISEKVTGKTSIYLEKAPWNQAFKTILRTNGLTYDWEGDIIRILTVQDMEVDLKRETQKMGLRLVEPLITRVITIEYADSKNLQENFQKLLTKNQDSQPLGAVMVDGHNNALVIQAIPTDIERMLALIQELDQPTPQILIEAQIVETTSETARDLGIQWGGLFKHKNLWLHPGANATGVVGNQLSAGGIDPTSGFVNNFPAALASGAGFTLGFAIENIGKDILATQLSALQKDGKLNILSSPSITTIDNKAAIIESGDEVPIQTIDNEGNASVEYKKAVLSLQVTPHVIEGDTLKLNIITSKDELDFSRTVSGNPTIITKKAETNVILYDGQTTVIGGLNKETKNNSEAGIPGLKDIPLLGYLFKGDSDSKKMEDILIFITPHILKQRSTPPKPAARAPQNTHPAPAPPAALTEPGPPDADRPRPVVADLPDLPHFLPSTSIIQPANESSPSLPLTPETSALQAPFAVQMGAFPTRRAANERLTLLRSHGEQPYLFIALDDQGQPRYAVRVGEFTNLAQAAEARQRLQQKLPFQPTINYTDSLQPVPH